MKKTILMALVTLLVMLAVSCDSSLIKQRPDDDGLVTLNVSTKETAGSRSLTEALAKTESTYMEVIFRKAKGTTPTETYDYSRASGERNGENLRVKLTPATYKIEDAIVLIGTNLTHTLLGTGTVTELNGVPLAGGATTFAITNTTASITFTLKALEANITAADSAAVDDFNNTDPPPATPKVHGFKIDDTTVGADFLGVTSRGTAEGKAWFQVPLNKSGIKATLNITGFAKTGDYIVRKAVSDINDVVTFGGPSATTFPIELESVTFTDSTSAATIKDGKITIGFSTEFDNTPPAGHIGEYTIFFHIPVVGFAEFTTPSGQIPWVIRGGYRTNQRDHAGDGSEGIALLVAEQPVILGTEVITKW